MTSALRCNIYYIDAVKDVEAQEKLRKNKKEELACRIKMLRGN
jgi:hypothetical protein